MTTLRPTSRIDLNGHSPAWQPICPLEQADAGSSFHSFALVGDADGYLAHWRSGVCDRHADVLQHVRGLSLIALRLARRRVAPAADGRPLYQPHT